MINSNDHYDYEKIFSYLDILNENANFDLIQKYKDILEFEFTHFIPAVRFDSALFLYQMALMKQPEHILEIGFGSGVSTYFIYNPVCSIKSFFSLEKDNIRFERGKKLIRTFGMEKVSLLNKDAFSFLQNYQVSLFPLFDFIFLDAGKKDYLAYLPFINRIIAPGGLLICDNTFFNGKVVLDEKLLAKPYVKNVPLLKKFNSELGNSELYKTTYFWIGDGMSLSIKK